MAPEISVERQFRFQCSCGETTESGEKTVICSGCGNTLGIRRVRRHRQRGNTVAYYGKTIRVRRVERHRQQSNLVLTAPKAQPVLHKPTLSSIEADFEDYPGDGPHGAFIVWVLLFWLVIGGLFALISSSSPK